jgi:hypothetical protein
VTAPTTVLFVDDERDFLESEPLSAGGLRVRSRLARFLDKPVTGRQLLGMIEELAGAEASTGEPAAV